MTAALRDRQLQRCCDALDQVSGGAPTLCEGWLAHDLAIHLWTLKHDPLGWPGIAVPSLAATVTWRADRIRRRWSYAELVARLRVGLGGIACMPFDRFEGHRHALGEYFVHTQDVVRANGLDQEKPGTDLEDALWLRVQVAARQLHRRHTPGLVLETTDGRSAQVTGGAPTTFITGCPSELMCWAYGREGIADVTIRR
ncbi:MAG: maleylpyruvate isomerase family mycothiol-dependent enzyme [Aeromicrobium sp.]